MLTLDKYTKIVEDVRTKLQEQRYSPEKLAELSDKLNLDFEEHYALQDAKSLMQQHQMIDLDVANHFYRLLGNTCEVFNKNDFVTKYVFLETMRGVRQLQQTIRQQNQKQGSEKIS